VHSPGLFILEITASMKFPYRLSIFGSVIFVYISFFLNVNISESTSIQQRFVHNPPPIQEQFKNLANTASLISPNAVEVSEGFAEAVESTLPAVHENVLSFIPSEALLQFVSQIVDGDYQSLRGVYVDSILALPVIQQPQGNFMFVAEEMGIITQFQSAAKHGVTGLLAHNYLSGDLFFSLEIDQEVNLVYGDGRVMRYQITDIQSYEKLMPGHNSLYLNIDSREKLSTQELFQRMYSGGNRVTFQTCIKKGSDWSWGRIFIIADPIH
jgi:hypothetical protein